jgi:hypothetical protein
MASKSNPNKNWVNAYYNLGLSIFPVQYRNKGPAKGVKWLQFQTTRPTSAQISNWLDTGFFWNIGVICGNISNDLVCVDIDDIDFFKNSILTPKIFIDNGAWVVVTGKGYHIYFLSDKPVNFTRKLSKSKKYEMRGNKHFMVLPPSTHSNGRKYRFLNSYNITNIKLPDIDDIDRVWNLFKNK